MHIEELDLKELLEGDTEAGLIRFVGQPAILFDAVALGLLRKELIDTFGVGVARGLLSRLGYAHGRRMAEAVCSQFTWDSEEDRWRAGSKIYALQGLYALEPGRHFAFDETGGSWRASYEAKQHLLHLGRADHPVCWTLCGLASGYLSRATGRELFAIEDRCLAKGDPACHITVKTAEEWGETQADLLTGFKREEIDATLLKVTEQLQRTELEVLRQMRKPAPAAKAEAEEYPSDIVVRSPAMQRVMELARTIAKVDSTVLITGESGTGKERVARFVHDQSACADGPFVAVNCGAISETLLESELFGHARGAFTGAAADRPGLFEAANGGTLFLDEVGEIPLSMQVKLLRALQEREVRRVGENTSRRIQVRIVTATNKALGPEVAAKRFREDLYYRLKVMELPIPPLRERREDILPLARLLLAEASARMKRAVEGLSAPVAERLLGYAWPGNVRELANVMERAVAITATNRVELEDLPPELRGVPPLPGTTGGIRPLEAVEKDYILAILEAKGGNRKEASEALGIGLATLHRKLKAYRADSAPSIQEPLRN